MESVTYHDVKEYSIVWGEHSLHSWELRPTGGPSVRNCTAVLLHGAGHAESARVRPLAEALARRGVRSIGLDFVGHGRTGGSLLGSSLDDRLQQAMAAIDTLAPDDELIICGFSMSGHTALRLTSSTNVVALGLFCPAVYSAAAERLPFGPQFSTEIRKLNSWKDSPALDAAAHFQGRAAICIGQQDNVIPWAVIENITSNLRRNSSKARLEIIGQVGHQIAAWMSADIVSTDSIAIYLTEGLVRLSAE